jgi:diacylglycerol O-acyltransferase
VRQDRHTVLRGKLGTVKTVTWCEPVPLDAVKAVGKQTGSSVNDVLLALIAGALRRYLIAHDSLVDEVGALVPFNIRPLDRPVPPELGNKFGLVFPALPIGLADPHERIVAVKRAMDAIKLSRQGLLTFGWLSTVGLTPAQLENALIDLYAGMGSVIITNVAGPRKPVSLAGTPATGLLLWVPTSGPIGVGLSIVSYDGRVTLGLIVDSQLVPDSERLRDALEAELDTFRSVATMSEDRE